MAISVNVPRALLRLEATLSPAVRAVLVRLRSARNKREGAAAFEELISLIGRPGTARDLEALFVARADVDLYARRLWWASFKLHLVEACVVPSGPKFAERIAIALLRARQGSVRLWLVDAVVRTGEQQWTAAFGARRLAERAAAVRTAVIRAVLDARHGEVSPAYARWAARTLDERLAQARNRVPAASTLEEARDWFRERAAVRPR